MNRRTLLKVLAFSSVLFSPLVRKAIAQNPPKPSDVPPMVPITGDGYGLPSDWTFVAPTQWETVERSLAAQMRPGLRADAPIDVAGIRVARAGKIETGQLDPVGDPIDLPESVSGIVRPADEVLDLAAVNVDLNPFIAAPVGAGNEPLVGPFHTGGAVFEGKTFLPVRLIMSKMVELAGVAKDVAEPMLRSLSELVVVRTPAHQFRLRNGLGNRVVFYGETEAGGETIDIGHTHIDKLVTALAPQNLRLIKQMVHFELPAQGGSPDDIVKNGVGGSTHAGGFALGFGLDGQPITVKSDWPSNYGRLGNNNKTYNAHLIAVDYSAGTEDPIPAAALEAYYRNADMWDACAAILVPFADQDPDPKFRDYQYNPLEVFDQASARAVAASLATLDGRAFLDKHGAFYCAEGQYVTANLGPQEDDTGGTLLKKSRYGDTPLGKLIDNFQNAPRYEGMTVEERRKHPYIGWEYLLELGADNGGISPQQALILQTTDRHGIALEWISEDIKGWQAYRPKDKEALIARPMTIATLAWALLRLYMPRDAVTKAIAGDLARAYTEGDASVQGAIAVLIGGADPRTREGQVALAGVAAKAATGLLLGLLSSDQVRDSILAKSGYNEITNDADQAKMIAAYQEFLGILQNADYATQSSLDRALAAADEKVGNIVVERSFYSRQVGKRLPAKSTVMKYAAPPCFSMWAQQPFLAGTGCLRYVATAMHVSQRKREAS
ncbi:MAG: hypothetical protein R3D30_03370 [Hyphomicrobiales bacterium]